MLLQIENPKSKIQNGRPGVTLTEVLLAIFVMGIGMLALLVLFPVGMLTMAQAIKDDRMNHASMNAEAVAEMIRPSGGTLRTDAAIELALRDEWPGQASIASPPLLPASLNPYFNSDLPPAGIAHGAARFNALGPSPPVFIDPQGTLLWPGGGGSLSPFVGRCVGVRPTPPGLPNERIQVQYWNPNTGTPQTTRPVWSYGIRRCRPSFAPSIADVRRSFMQEDEITFEPNGEPRRNGLLVERWRKYSWAYMWRKPRWNEPKMADLTIVMFSGRQIEGVGTPGLGNPPEPHFLGYNPPPFDPRDGRAFIAGSTVVRLKMNLDTNGDGIPDQALTLPAKAGDWLLDATVIPPDPTVTPPVLTHFNGYFYKIVGVGHVEPINATEVYQTIEINRPALADGYVGVMITGVADVIEKNDGRMPAN